MIAKREVWEYPSGAKVWAGKYRNSHNLLHWHYDCECIYVERGSLEVYCERKLHLLTAGEALFTDSGQMHYQRALEEGTLLEVIVFESGLLPFLKELRLAEPKLKGSYPFPAAYARLMGILRERAPFFGEEARCVLSELFIDIFRREELLRRVREGGTEAAFKHLLEALESDGELGFEDAVRLMNMSEAYFSRYFKAMTGSTFTQYVNVLRTERAVELLKQRELSMTEIAERAGFPTIRSFNRTFKELTGVSPSQLPKDYSFGARAPLASGERFLPTLSGCTLVESCT